SPLRRAVRTCELAGFGPSAVVDPDLVEGNYGDYEGRRTADVRKERPGWDLFRDGCPHGETADGVGGAARPAASRLRAAWGAPPRGGGAGAAPRAHSARGPGAGGAGGPGARPRHSLLSPAALSILGYEHTPQEPVLRLWNDDRHVGP